MKKAFTLIELVVIMAILSIIAAIAMANQKIAGSLTPLLVQNRMIEKLSDKVQLMIVPQGQNFLMQLPDMKK